MLRNPIYCGWRVISQKRDPSPRAHKVKPDGRQADRPKINRNADEVIKIKVIEQPLVSEEDFRRAQEMMSAKRLKHWRSDPERHHRWTYNGFLTCGLCQNLVYTKFYRGRDYYVCKARRNGTGCSASYMRRADLEDKLDQVFGKNLTDEAFLTDLAQGQLNGNAAAEHSNRITKAGREIQKLLDKRDRVLETYFEGMLSREERDTKLQQIDKELSVNRELLSREAPLQGFSSESLAEIFSVFSEWQFLKREEKRQLLSCLIPEIRVADYKIYGLSLMSAAFRGNEESHNRAAITDRDSGSASVRK
jgi:hypothetical protein